MQPLLRLCLLLLWVSVAAMAYTPSKFKYFDEYLVQLERKQQSIIVNQIEIKTAVFLRTGKVRSKEEQCCTLGQMAGERGFHCFSQFYAARVLNRNYNRAHNKRIPALLKGKQDSSANKLMRTFGQCVLHRGAIFHKCCKHAALMQ